MKFFFQILLFFLLITQISNAQWHLLNSGTTNGLNSVSFTDANTGTTVGSGTTMGTILRTTDGGTTWIPQGSGIANKSELVATLFSVSFTDANTGTTVGLFGKIFRTTNGGTTWISQWSGTSEPLYCVSFANANNGIAVGDFGRIPSTTNGGNTWTLNFYTTSNQLYGVSFSDANTGTAVGNYGTIIRTTNGGTTWTSQTSGATYGLYSVSFTDANTGTAVGYNGTIIRTTDGGTTWTSQTSGTTNSLYGVSFTDANNGTVVGHNGTIIRTTDGGITWISQTSGTTQNLRSVSFTDAYSGYAVGDNGTILKYSVPQNVIVTSPNGGEIWKSGWQRNITWSSENISSINLYYTTDSGSNWNTIATNVDANIGSYNWTIPILTWFINLNCKVKIEDASNSSVYDESDNNFIIWHFCNIIQYANLGQRIIDFLETNIDISLNVTTSDNISVTYYPYAKPTGGTLPSGVVVLSDYYWQVTSANLIFSNGKIIVPISTLRGVTDATKLVWLKRTNSGDDWENIGGIVSGENLESTVIFNSFSEFAIGSTDPVNPLPVELYSFEASVGGSSVNLKWKTKTEVNNYGFEVERCLENSWEKIGFVQGYGNSNSPKSYSFSDNNPFGGSKFQYRLKQLDTDGQFEYSDIVEVEILPNKFALFQNYPNPFNPATKIRYQLPEESKVIIKIYDILGTEVATLVNAKREPGTYEVELNSNSLSSGTYIYRIVAGEFVETKKMILIK